MPGVFKLRISSGVTGREHAYATISSIGALSQCERPAGIFLVDLRGETRFAGVAGAAGSVGDGGVTLAAGITGLPGAGLPGAIEGSGAILAAVTTVLPAAGAPGAVEGAGGIMAVEITGVRPS
jgi:hypothetical protein